MTIPVNGLRFPCCPARPGQLLIPIPDDPCLTDPAPTVVDARVITGNPGPLCDGTFQAPTILADLVIEVEFSEAVTGVTECATSGDCTTACRNIRIFRCTTDGCPDPEAELEAIPDSIAFNPTTNVATLTFTSFGPAGGNPTLFRLVVGDNALCPIVDVDCGKTLVPFRCNFNVNFPD